MNDYILNFGEINQKFVEWFCSNGGKISPKIAFKDYSSENSGRGVVAVDDIQPFEVLFSIPHSIILSEKTSSLKDLIPSDEFEKLGKINSWFPLILCMMYESQKEDSLWKPYFDILPREFDTPMFWNEEQLAELEGTSVIDKIGRVEAEIQFNEHLLPIIQYNTYGELCSADLLRKYGFVDENNIHDIVELNGQFVVDTLSIDEDTKDKKAFKLNIEMLLEEDILNDILILDTTKEIPPELIIIAKIMTMDKAQFKKFRKTNNFPEPKMNLDIKTRLIQLFEKRLSMYKTSIKEDDEILKSNNISLKLKYTIIMRLSEKRILHGLLDNLNNWNDDEKKEEIQRKKRKIK
ncbi:2131_t:CDS:2 [Funneliformis caledonium]|uniref:2131_t:CDS:1 n=1 Tax=Funneliformis caledonium TaxID=1117310 RepID=A0A9N9FPG8_9GLOM|nr:2131_t:CDS:2 [Funneliformis caledonium]